MDFWGVIIFFIAYFVAMKYILPKLGVSTWMSNSCDLPGERQKKSEFESTENIKE